MNAKQAIEMLSKCHPDATVKIVWADEDFCEDLEFIADVDGKEILLFEAKPDQIEEREYWDESYGFWLEVLTDPHEPHFAKLKKHQVAPSELSA